MAALEPNAPATIFGESEHWFFWANYVHDEAMRSTNPERRNYLFCLADEYRRKAARLGDSS